jgi:hypothetical protein
MPTSGIKPRPRPLTEIKSVPATVGNQNLVLVPVGNQIPVPIASQLLIPAPVGNQTVEWQIQISY